MEATAYYREKTQRILDKYGPGPRVHYHVGVYEEGVQGAQQLDLLQRQITQGQEDMMVVASECWGVPSSLRGKRVLDVGAGLGGASLWMATHKGAQVDALVQCREHGEIIRGFAALCGLDERIGIWVGDAHETPCVGLAQYDAVMAMESPCYFDRRVWMQHLSRLLREDGVIWIEDVFLTDSTSTEAKSFFDRYWKTDIGTIQSYLLSARAAGFSVEIQDITAETIAFWSLSASWIRLAYAREKNEQKRTSLSRSLDAALFHLEGWRSQQFCIALLALRRA